MFPISLLVSVSLGSECVSYFCATENEVELPVQQISKLSGFSPQAKYTDQETAACRRS
jgi:adenosine/AMP kinase